VRRLQPHARHLFLDCDIHLLLHAGQGPKSLRHASHQILPPTTCPALTRDPQSPHTGALPLPLLASLAIDPPSSPPTSALPSALLASRAIYAL
jgi:hypothetical protein